MLVKGAGQSVWWTFFLWNALCELWQTYPVNISSQQYPWYTIVGRYPSGQYATGQF